ncbi:IclR family transcriptional regulator [Lentilitoribacter sp. Alg239-R112]|uniref:IclR family transcriptional regulator n=1 Tax=Lentilitoribacter sp. Alg239-R112 TaxID=2305987 RepID=UPI0018DA2D2F|nr:IclR family transcriptional regulator [Lentilitoribacter sp. Alg239-R112]
MQFRHDNERNDMGTITKALEMLGYFSSSQPEIGLTQFVSLSGRDKATVHRHLVELTENGILEQDQKTRLYRLGSKILRLAAVREITHPLRSVAEPIVRRISEQVGELAHFTILQDMSAQSVCFYDPQIHGTHVHYNASEIFPLHATSSGLAILAFGQSDIRRAVRELSLPTYTNKTITDHAQLDAMISDVQKTGFSFLKSAYDVEVSSQAAPIFGSDGQAMGALSIAVPNVRMYEGRDGALKKALSQGVHELTQAIGGVVPPELATRWEQNV